MSFCRIYDYGLQFNVAGNVSRQPASKHQQSRVIRAAEYHPMEWRPIVNLPYRTFSLIYFLGGSLNVSGVFWRTHCLLFSRSEYQDQNTASSRLVSKSPDQRDSRNQTQKRPGDGTWDLHSGLTELLPVQGALSSFQASFRQPGEKFSALHKASLVSGSELRTAVDWFLWRATVRHGRFEYGGSLGISPEDGGSNPSSSTSSASK